MIKNLGLQLYTVRDYFKDADFAALTFRKMAELGYTEAHTAGNYGFTPEEFVKLANDNGVKIIGTHYCLLCYFFRINMAVGIYSVNSVYHTKPNLFAASSRILYFNIFPAAFIGNLSTNSI